MMICEYCNGNTPMRYKSKSIGKWVCPECIDILENWSDKYGKDSFIKTTHTTQHEAISLLQQMREIEEKKEG